VWKYERDVIKVIEQLCCVGLCGHSGHEGHLAKSQAEALVLEELASNKTPDAALITCQLPTIVEKLLVLVVLVIVRPILLLLIVLHMLVVLL
jgi:hypothetical protein